MKANRPSLILYFTALLLTIIFDCTNQEFLAVYAKAIVVPSIFFYFFVSNNNKIDKVKFLIFFFCFVGQVFDLMDIEISNIGELFSFLIVYLLLLKLIIVDYEKIKIKKSDFLPVTMVIIFIVYLLISVLNLQFDNVDEFHFAYIFYGIVLSILGFVSYVSYITKGTYVSLLLTLMSSCFIFSDIFYIFIQFFSDSIALVLIQDITQIGSYFFMVKYFLEKKSKNTVALHYN
ncbi:hypothetical protein GON26_07815 [Flavobacterium sp. GA093]|uniref:YhhN-like protein n=1 Tax=Flavobacterium hydrocarbonoxydans TaxID=2683249 RepID=A0A6I4NIF8_9FLAO|nr:hypothetical protein [Flavobacterium hydrocarbonoxydans]MWB94266.1 hypothetical protein [Flavobacterium hydrocarbonoxydans]